MIQFLASGSLNPVKISFAEIHSRSVLCHHLVLLMDMYESYRLIEWYDRLSKLEMEISQDVADCRMKSSVSVAVPTVRRCCIGAPKRTLNNHYLDFKPPGNGCGICAMRYRSFSTSICPFDRWEWGNMLGVTPHAGKKKLIGQSISIRCTRYRPLQITRERRAVRPSNRIACSSHTNLVLGLVHDEVNRSSVLSIPISVEEKLFTHMH